MRLIDYFDHGVRLYPDNIAFIDVDAGNTSMTYAEAYELTQKIAGAIRGRGYDKGAHIGVLAPNSTDAFLTLLGVFRSESVWLPVNPRNAVATNIDLLARFDSELLFYHSAYEKEAKEIADAIPDIREIVCIDGNSDAGSSFESWSAGCPETWTSNKVDLDDIFAIGPTGGTTGKPKGVMISHKNIASLYNNYYSHFNYYDNTVHLVVAPMTHTAGLTGGMHFARGGTNVIMRQADPAGIAHAIGIYGVTHLFLPPTVLYMMLALPEIREGDFSTLQHFLVGAAPSSLEKLKQAIDVFGPVMTEAYGQSEAPAAITTKAPWDYLDKDGNIIEARLKTIGRPCINGRVAILDDNGGEVARGQAGEICIQGDLVTPGYYKNPEATAEVRAFGWHHTTDIGVMDEDGFISIIDRKKDMIITGGFNVFPNEIEQVLNSNPAVQDCAVIGVPDEKWGEAIKAVIELKPGASCDAQVLIDQVKRELGSIKAPKSIDFVGQLPLSPVGKVLKAEIRKQFWQDQERSI